MTTFNWTISTLEYDLTENNSVITAKAAHDENEVVIG